MSHLTLTQRLAEAGITRLEAERHRTSAAADLRYFVKQAAEAGWPKTRIAKVAGISRQTVHEMLKD